MRACRWRPPRLLSWTTSTRSCSGSADCSFALAKAGVSGAPAETLAARPLRQSRTGRWTLPLRWRSRRAAVRIDALPGLGKAIRCCELAGAAGTSLDGATGYSTTMPEESTTRDPVDTVRLYFQTIASDWDFDAVAGLFAPTPCWICPCGASRLRVGRSITPPMRAGSPRMPPRLARIGWRRLTPMRRLPSARRALRRAPCGRSCRWR
jgi:hypothetical protein